MSGVVREHTSRVRSVEHPMLRLQRNSLGITSGASEQQRSAVRPCVVQLCPGTVSGGGLQRHRPQLRVQGVVFADVRFSGLESAMLRMWTTVDPS